MAEDSNEGRRWGNEYNEFLNLNKH
jgi:hypothetical protein